MAENKYLNLNGLQYYTRKLDEKKANLESPVFTGTPKAPTVTRGTNDTSIATTEFVNNEFEKVVKWDNAEQGVTVTVTTNMVVLAEEQYESLNTKIPNTFYFIYDNEGATPYDI